MSSSRFVIAPVPDADALHLSANNAIPDCVHAVRAADLPLNMYGSDGEWSPDLSLPSSLWEIFSSGDDASGEALALALVQQRQAGADNPSWLWVQEARSIRQGGRPYLHGLPSEFRSGFIHVEARNAADALWAMEEGVRCGSLSFVLGEIAGDPRALDFTATRRLALAAERHGVPLYLLRRGGSPDLSAARLRWRVEAASSFAHKWNAAAPGAPRAVAELFRGRGLKPGRFMLGHGIGQRDGSHEPGRGLAVVPELRDRQVEPQHRMAGR